MNGVTQDDAKQVRHEQDDALRQKARDLSVYEAVPSGRNVLKILRLLRQNEDSVTLLTEHEHRLRCCAYAIGEFLDFPDRSLAVQRLQRLRAVNASPPK